jgi:endonuclease/exonuclease/phosphatase family metal-dependent hydrolase
LSQTAKAIRESKADVVGLQEIGRNLQKLAELLKWNRSSQGWSGIVTRFEIVKEYRCGKNTGGIRVRTDSGREVLVFNAYFSPGPYQPYQLLNIPYGKAPFIKTEEEAIAFAKKTRGSQVGELLKQVEKLADENLPIFCAGDFNEPSHLDWTEAAAKAKRHPIKVAYPTSIAMLKAGFVDSYRKVYPDEMKHPGFTWTPLAKPDDPKVHHDRIDLIYFKGGGIKVDRVQIVGESKENADIVISPYPTDHRGVVTTVTLPGK